MPADGRESAGFTFGIVLPRRMVSERAAFGSVVAGITVGLAFLVYGMWLSAGQAWNTPAIAGGVVVLAALAVMTVRVMALDAPAH